MAEYIEKEKAIAAIEERARLRNHAHDMISYQQLKLTKWNIEDIPAADVVPGSDFRDCRNELCLYCGKYKERHLGACDGCRWRPE